MYSVHGCNLWRAPEFQTQCDVEGRGTIGGGGGGGGEERAPKYAAPQYNRPPHCLIPVSATGYYRWYPGNDPAPHTHTCQPYSHFPPSSRSPTLSIHPMPNLLHLMPTFLPQRPCLASRNDINEVLEVWQHHIAS